MAITSNNGCFGSHGGCERPHHCDIPSSKIFYDGETIEEAGLYHGMPLNRALANLAKYVSRAINVSGSVNTEVFDGTSHVVLKKDPAEILLVSYCGGVVPSDMYKVQGRTVKFCRDMCQQDEFAEVRVVYREEANSSYGFHC